MSVWDVINVVLMNLGLRRHLWAWWGLSGFGFFFFGLNFNFSRITNIISPWLIIHLTLIALCRCCPILITSLF